MTERAGVAETAGASIDEMAESLVPATSAVSVETGPGEVAKTSAGASAAGDWVAVTSGMIVE